jgi:hypothetical protein
MRSPITAIALLALLAWACGEGAISDPTPAVAGKADSKDKASGQDPCALDGTFVFYGDYPSFTRWSVTFQGGALIDSHTDDLTAEEWPTTAIQDPHDRDNLSLVQITHASDAIITTTLYLQRSCGGGVLALRAAVGQTVFFDLTSGESSVETHDPVWSAAQCEAHVRACRAKTHPIVAQCRSDCPAGPPRSFCIELCFEECMDDQAWPCPKLCDDGRRSRAYPCS